MAWGEAMASPPIDGEGETQDGPSLPCQQRSISARLHQGANACT